ncbi:undecaprenyl-diphosphate phosphatase [Candidatus Epulonipiscium viviparus]|uniref:undecaprenyl-diphosphate phosphatase n=1 Tax=Candidatus Epulonipiscium viviparus TaxID=420336 RepID=UPI00016C0EB0|nr:undecaprenyl-diphosphate phosphatase [Candidatus Epulopiscium viviparus]
MDLFFMIKAGVLGIVEGLTEFLPVSSTGHLIIFSNLLDFYSHTNKEFVDMFNMVIQLGATLAVVFLYRKKIMDTIINLFPSQNTPPKNSGMYFWLMICISCIPAAVIGIPFDDAVQHYLFNPLVVAIALFVGGVLMILAEDKLKNHSQRPLTAIIITPKQAIIVGLFQVFSIIPGVSRSASTIIGGWVGGLGTVAAAEYSFFLAIPVMFGQAFLNLLDAQGTLVPNEWAALFVGFLVSFIVAIAVIGSFLDFLKKKPMKYFAVYRMIFAFLVLAYGLFFPWQ